MAGSAIPTGISRNDVFAAFGEIRRDGIPAGFEGTSEHVVVFEGTWFPPKAVLAVAARRLAGRVLSVDEVAGGDGPGTANRILRRLGFDVIRRRSSMVVNDPVVEWCAAVSSTRRAVVEGEVSSHQPTTILYFIGRFLYGQSQFARWIDIKRELRRLLALAGGRETPEFPLQVLATAGVLDARGLGTLEDEKRWYPSNLDNVNPAFGLPAKLYTELGVNPDRVAEIIEYVGATFATTRQFEIVRREVEGLDSYGLFGHVPNIGVGATFATREEVRIAGLHKHGMRGISTVPDIGANAIVISGGYPDDEDHGDWFVYTGEGGRDPKTQKQTADQTLTIGNQGLIWSFEKQIPVRVIRGSGGDPAHSPASGYRYDGLYHITRQWTHRADDGFLRFHFQFERDSLVDATPPTDPQLTVPLMPSGRERPERRPRTSSQIVRDSKVKAWVKKLYNFECQVCGHIIETRSGRIAEAAHIVPLGDPHNGPDVPENILCLCPNHHRAFDAGVWVLSDEWRVIDTASGNEIGLLTLSETHTVNVDYVRVHRAIHCTSQNL